MHWCCFPQLDFKKTFLNPPPAICLCKISSLSLFKLMPLFKYQFKTPVHCCVRRMTLNKLASLEATLVWNYDTPSEWVSDWRSWSIELLAYLEIKKEATPARYLRTHLLWRLFLGILDILNFCFLTFLKGILLKSFNFGTFQKFYSGELHKKSSFHTLEGQKYFKGVFQPAGSIPWMLILPL